MIYLQEVQYSVVSNMIRGRKSEGDFACIAYLHCVYSKRVDLVMYSCKRCKRFDCDWQRCDWVAMTSVRFCKRVGSLSCD